MKAEKPKEQDRHFIACKNCKYEGHHVGIGHGRFSVTPCQAKKVCERRAGGR